MLDYLVVMGVIVAAAILMPQRKPNVVAWAMAFIVLVVFVGLRHKVGMDWNNYLLMIIKASDGSMIESLKVAEPGYAILLWLSAQANFGVYGANLVGAIALLLGIFRYSSRTPLPWVSLATAMPILIVVVGMSANRQAMAIGVLLWLAAGWANCSLRKRVMLTILAAMFHFSAIFFLMFAALGLRIKAIYKVFIAVFMIAGMLFFLQASGGADYYDQLYVSGQSEVTYSPGAILHVLLNGIPAMLVLTKGSIRTRLFPTTLHVQMALVAMVLIPTALVFSAAAGRMTLYLFPVSMYVFSALPTMFSSATQRAALRTALSGFMFGVLWFWLEFANSSAAHVPYDNAILMDAHELNLCCG